MRISSHKELEVFKLAFSLALEIDEITKGFPVEERYSLTDQIRRSSRSVCSNIAEAFRKRRYKKHFILKLTDAEAESAETQVWLEFCKCHQYISEQKYEELFLKYDHVLSMIVRMENNFEKWTYNPE